MADANLAPEKKVKSVKIEFGDTEEEVIEGSVEHTVLTQEFDRGIKYMFELAVEIAQREHPVIDMRTKRPAPVKKFSPYRNMVMTSQIVWKGQRRMLRYYDGCTTIFADKHPKDKELLEQLIKQSSQRAFIDGKFGCYGEERLLILYLLICSWNVESPFRTRVASGVFRPLNSELKVKVEAEKLDETEKALEAAKGATKTKMLIHASYLGIPTVDWDSGNDLTEEEIRTEYRKEALRNSTKFLQSFGNTAIESKFYIDKALEKGVISNKFNTNKATWATSNREICDISGLKSLDAISQRLFEFSQTDEGKEFMIQLTAVMNK